MTDPAKHPTHGKDTWRTPVDELVLVHQIFGGSGAPPAWSPRMWREPDAQQRYLDCLAWLRLHGRIGLDPCADRDALYHFAAENLAHSGLEQSWVGFSSFANVPYSAIAPWVSYGAAQAAEARAARQTSATNALFLIPASMSNLYWVNHLLCPGQPLHPVGPGVNLLAVSRGRISFLGPSGPVGGNPLGSALVGWIDPGLADGAVLALERAGWSVLRRPAQPVRLSWSLDGAQLRRGGEQLAGLVAA